MSSLNSNPSNKQQKQGNDIFDFDRYEDVVNTVLNPVSTSVAFLLAFWEFLFGFLRTACVPGELLFRRNFGERHFSLYLYMGGALWFWVFAIGIVNFPQWLGVPVNPLVSNATVFTVIGVLYFGLMFWHMVIRKFLPLNLDNYSRYDGDVLPFLYWLPFTKDKDGNPDEYRVRQVIEPAFIFLVGCVVSSLINPQTGSFVVMTALGMALKELVRAQKFRDMVLDFNDAQILNKNIKAAVKGEPLKNTQHVYIAGLPRSGSVKQRFDAIVEGKASHPDNVSIAG